MFHEKIPSRSGDIKKTSTDKKGSVTSFHKIFLIHRYLHFWKITGQLRRESPDAEVLDVEVTPYTWLQDEMPNYTNIKPF